MNPCLFGLQSVATASNVVAYVYDWVCVYMCVCLRVRTCECVCLCVCVSVPRSETRSEKNSLMLFWCYCASAVATLHTHTHIPHAHAHTTHTRIRSIYIRLNREDKTGAEEATKGKGGTRSRWSIYKFDENEATTFSPKQIEQNELKIQTSTYYDRHLRFDQKWKDVWYKITRRN